MKIYNNMLISGSLKTNNSAGKAADTEQTAAGGSFQQILNDKIEASEVQFSKHASMRLNSRSIKLTDEQMGRVSEGVEKAAQKGIRDSLLLVDDIALVVNVKNRVVITAMDGESQGNVFTNIDGAVIV